MVRNGYILMRWLCSLELYQANTHFILLSHWNNSPWIGMSLHSDILSWIQVKPYLLLFVLVFFRYCVLSEEAADTNDLVFDLTWPGFELLVFFSDRGLNSLPTAFEANTL